MEARARRSTRRLPLAAVLALLDVVALLVTAGAFVLLHRAAGDAGPARSSAVVATLVAAGFAHAGGLHRPRWVLSLLEDLPGLVATAVVGTVALTVAGRALGTDVLPGWPSRVAFTLAALAVLVLLRAVTYAAVRLLRRLRVTGTRLLVVGTGPTARRLCLTLLLHPEHGLEPVGFLDEARGEARRGLPLPLVGTLAGLPATMAATDVRAVLFAPDGAIEEAEAATAACVGAGVTVLAPTSSPLTRHRVRHPVEVLGEDSVVRLYARPATGATRAVQRLATALVSAVSLVVLAPVVLVLAALVRVETGPGVVVRRPRVDEAGRTDMQPKFRTRRGAQMAGNATTWQLGPAGRVGPVGRFLRRTRLDALPQVVRQLSAQLRVVPIRSLRPRPGPEPEAAAPWASAPASRDEAEVDAGQLAG